MITKRFTRRTASSLAGMALLALNIAPMTGVAAATILGTRGDIVITTDDHRAFYYALDDAAEYPNTLRDPAGVKSAVNEILTLKQVGLLKARLGVLTEREKKYFDFTLEKAHQTALLTITEKRAKDAAQADAVVLEKRAREIYQLAEPAAHKSELRADFQNILFDLQARSFVETAERITAAQKALAAGVAFDEIVAQYSDEKGAAEHKGWARKINARALDGRLGRVIFDELKPGEYSTPIASRVGIHIVKLHAIEQPVKLPFDTVKPALIQKLVQERGKNAQRDLMQALSSSSTSFNDAEISKLYAPIDPIAIERARQISLESAKQARDFAKQVK